MQTIAYRDGAGKRALSIVILAAIIEGFDIQAAGVAIPRLAPEFGLSPNQIGLFFSAATFGLIFGALSGGIVADRWGRRAGLVLSLVTFGVFSITTAFAQTFEQLLVARFLVGVGLGGALPNLVNIAAEAVDTSHRGRAVSIMYAGIPAGGAIVSLMAMSNLFGESWRTIFVVGGILPILLAPFVHMLLPPLAIARTERRSTASAFSVVLTRSTLATTLALWLAFFLGLLVLYLLLNWMPQLLVSRGLGRGEASLVQVLFNVGGIVGCLVGGRMLDRSSPARPVALCFGGAAAALLMLGLMPAQLALMLLGGTLAGAAIMCVQAILYGLAPQCYSFEVRGTGVGLAVAVGRLGSITGPLFAGLLVAGGFSPSQVMFALVPVMLAAGLTTVILLSRGRPQASLT